LPDSSADLLAKTRRLIGLQLAACAAVAAAFLVGKESWDAISAGYGGVISLSMTVLLSRGVMLAGRAAADRGRSQAILYLGAGIRFVLVLALFGLGLAVIGFAPLATVVGFVVTQSMLLLSAMRPQHGR
jgi:hypothetical protein